MSGTATTISSFASASRSGPPAQPSRPEDASASSQDADVAKAGSLRARLSQRLARHVPTAPALLVPETALVSFTFDDTPVCSATVGAEILAAQGGRATYYIAGGLIGTRSPLWRHADEDALAAVHAAGHELGSHTYGHVLVPGLSRAGIAEESRRNRERLRAIVPDLDPSSFAFPYGSGSIRAKRALGRCYATCRSIVPGLNHGRGDLHYLRAHPFETRSLDAARIAGLMDDALRRKGWLIFYGHDVTSGPSPFGCTPGLLETAARVARERGIPSVTIAEGLRRAVR